MTVTVNRQTDALIHVDVMSTFMEKDGGGLPVKDGHLVVPVIKRVDMFFPRERRFASRESHPAGHMGNASSYVDVEPFFVITPEVAATWDEMRLNPVALFEVSDLREYVSHFGKLQVWADHAQQDTLWERLHRDLDEADYAFVQVKGDVPTLHPFSALCDEYGRPMELAKRLLQEGVRRVFVDGLALDYCVEATCKDAVELGFEVYLILDATRPVVPAQGLVTIQRFVAMGVHVIDSKWLRAA